MKREELRVGNLVYGVEFGSSNMVYTNAEPIVIDAECIGLTAHWGGDIYQPIPLTEEILIKCGFEVDENKYRNFSFTMEKWANGKLMYGWIGGNVEVKYLHELQNLYYTLTKEELDVNKLLNNKK